MGRRGEGEVLTVRPSHRIRRPGTYGFAARAPGAIVGSMSSSMSGDGRRPPPIDPATMRRLLVHEARIHAVPHRDLRDLGDALLLHDPTDPEPFWNRLEAVRWPADPAGFDRRLAEALVLFATLGRRPHIWASPLHDEPPDLTARLLASGFVDTGPGELRVLADPEPVRAAVAVVEALGLPEGVTLERPDGVVHADEVRVAAEVTDVLIDAFEAGPDRRPELEQQTRALLRHPWFSHYLVRLDGRAAAVARRATFDGISYLSAIGTAGWAQRRGLGRLVTAVAAADALAAGSEWVHLGVFTGNTGAVRLYEGLGFERVGQPAADLVLV